MTTYIIAADKDEEQQIVKGYTLYVFEDGDIVKKNTFLSIPYKDALDEHSLCYELNKYDIVLEAFMIKVRS